MRSESIALGSACFQPGSVQPHHIARDDRYVLAAAGIDNRTEVARALEIRAEMDDARLILRAYAIHEAFSEWVRHTYAARFLGNAAASPTHIVRCAAGLRTTAVRKLVRPNDLRHLDEVLDYIAAEVGEG